LTNEKSEDVEMLDYAVLCFWFFLGCVFLIGWYAKQAFDDIKAEQKEKERAEYVRRREEKLEDAHRRWDASMEAVKELWI
jgi:hypothetical protein